jgi:chromosomal replication initiation ATPase DnaA
MRHRFVKTSNHRRFMASVTMLRNRGSQERCILALKGMPGVGKTREVDNWGSSADAVFIEGIPGMSLRYLKDALKAESGVRERGSFAEFAALVDFFRNDAGQPRPIILDECQHGFPRKAECIEYLRRLAEKAGTILVLVCHTSESYLLNKYDHIRTRIGCVCELLPPSLEDVALFAQEQCEVMLDAKVIAEVLKQSGARYRLVADALATLERIAERLNKSALVIDDVKGAAFCQDWEKALRPATKHATDATSNLIKAVK